MKKQKSAPSTEALANFAKENSWETKMNSGGLDSFSNYSGENLGDLVVVLGTNRDSDLLSQSNFESALELLGGEGRHVRVESFGHWACGWFKLILVNPKSKKHLTLAYEIKMLLQEYPILNEGDYFERETEAFSEFAKEHEGGLAEALEAHFGIKKGPQLRNIAFNLNMECQHYFGPDSCIDIYTTRAPDSRDIDRLVKILSQLDWQFKNSKKYQALVRRVQEFKNQLNKAA